MADGEFSGDAAWATPAAGPAAICSIEAEQALLGALMIDPDALGATPGLRVADFFEPTHQALFAAILARSERGAWVAPTALYPELAETSPIDELGGLGYLRQLVNLAVSQRQARVAAEHVVDLARRRALRETGEALTLSAAAENGAPAAERIMEAETRVATLAAGREEDDRPVGVKRLFLDGLRHIDRLYQLDGAAEITTGFRNIDELTGGLKRDWLYVLAGRPGMGKSAIALNIGWNAALSGARVRYYSLEMSREEVACRLMSLGAGVSYKSMLRGTLSEHEFRSVALYAQGLSEDVAQNFTTLARGGLSINAIAADVRRAKRLDPVDVVIVDYLQLCTTGLGANRNREQEVAYISRTLRDLSKELNVCVVALSQLSRRLEDRAVKRPVMSDLRESGAIEQDANVVAFIHRDEFFLAQSEPEQGSPEHRDWLDRLDAARGKAELIIAKNRSGETGAAKLRFEARTGRFVEESER